MARWEMNFKDQQVSFEEADRLYAELERQRETGAIDERQFDAQRRRLMVQDEEGRWWIRSRETGRWHYHDGDAWVESNPPDTGAAVTPDAAAATPDRTQAPEPAPVGKERRRGGMAVWILAALVIVLLGLQVWSLIGGGGSGGANFDAAFVHRATPDNISEDNTYLDNALINDNPDAVLYVTQHWNPDLKDPNEGVYNGHPVGVWYDPNQGRWAILNEDREAMPEGAAFNVLVLEEASE